MSWFFRTFWILTLDTFRQSFASRAFQATFAAIAVSILLCSSAHIETVENVKSGDVEIPKAKQERVLPGEVQKSQSRLSLGFGMISTPLFRDPASQVHFLLVAIAKWGRWRFWNDLGSGRDREFPA